MDQEKNNEIRTAVRNVYGQVAEDKREINISSEEYSRCSGYSEEQLRSVPEEAQMSLGCGNALAIAALKYGEVVLDLGCGGGFDCFLAARAVGKDGYVIGLDMTPEMIHRARRIAHDNGYSNVEFRLGEIEHIPVADQCVDVILSNCVINLSPNKPQVFSDAFRVLRPGGRVAINDIVSVAPLSLDKAAEPCAVSECVAGASSVDEIEEILIASGFEKIRVKVRPESREMIRQWSPGTNIDKYFLAATIEAGRPFGL